MTPNVPRGDPSGSPPPIRTENRVAIPTPGIAATVDSPPVAPDFYQPFRLSLEGGYLIHGEAGFAARGGLLGRFRPIRELGLGIRFDSNFSDEIITTLRVEGILPVSREFSLFAATEGGVRALLHQMHSQDGAEQYFSGALAALGIEAGADYQADEHFAVGLFTRLLYSPEGGLSVPGTDSNPAHGIRWGGHEFHAGIRLSWDFGNSTPSSEDEAETRERLRSVPSHQTRRAITQMEALVENLQEQTESRDEDSTATGPTPEVPVAASENLRAIREELRELRQSSEALEVQIAAATQTFRDLQRGQETGMGFRIRLDRIYDGLIARPPRLDAAEANAFLGELTQVLQENHELQLLIRSSTESFGPALLNNLGHLQTELQAYQRGRRANSPRSGNLSGSALDPLFPRLSSAIAIVQDLRNRLIDTRPTNDRIALWRESLASIERHLAAVSSELDPRQRELAESQFSRLRGGFEALTAGLDESERLWLISRASYGHFQSFQAASRPEAVVAALQAMLAEFQRSPETFRGVHARGLTNLQVELTAFIERLSLHPRRPWNAAREAAIAVVQWIDPSYQPPAVARIRTHRRNGQRGAGERPRPGPIEPRTAGRRGAGSAEPGE